jgi:DNA-binding transcriptional LysR family regulator
MDRDLLSHLPVVMSVARHRGFAPAAAALGMSPSAVSHAVRTVEDRLGEPLFLRTTRSVSLSEAGTRFLASVEPALADINKAAENLNAERGEVTGLLRINTVRVALDMALTPILARLAWQHPRLTVEVYSDDALVDIVERGFDAGIRLGEMVQQDMIAVRLTRPFKVIVVASPEYLDAKGVPQTIGDLHLHNCIGLRAIGSGGIYNWELRDGKKVVPVKTSGTALVTDPTHALELALAGVGIAYAIEPLARRHIRERRLRWLLQQCAVEYDGLFLYYPLRASLAPKLRVFIDVAKAVLANR